MNGLISRARVVRWSSSDEQIATVSGSGLVKALRLGTAQITVRSSAGTENTTLSVVERVLPEQFLERITAQRVFAKQPGAWG